ncbi:MAG: type I phosphomannose isomerase catalytic subunit [Planctomycetota bacterium]|jgi:mannose-6-phosphate isomerase
MDIYPYKFEPIYMEKIWGGRNIERLFARPLPTGKKIGESWELADLKEGTSVVTNGPAAGKTLTELTAELGERLLGRAEAMSDGRFPLLLKFLDANDILSLQVHPDARAAAEIGGGAAAKTECWYIVESRGGCIYKGVRPGATPQQFLKAVETDAVESLVQRYDVKAGDFHYLPAGTVHALGAGVVVAEVQTPSYTTYRVTDWGRGRETHVERTMQCIHFEPTGDEVPGREDERLLKTDDFEVFRRTARPGECGLPDTRCTAWMVLSGRGKVAGGDLRTPVGFAAGDTLLLPAALADLTVSIAEESEWLEVVLPEK